MSIEKLLKELESRSIQLTIHRGGLRATGQTANLTDDLKAEVARHKHGLIAQLSRPSTAIQDAIGKAQTWEDLSSLCKDIDAAFQAGDIDTEVADELTNLVRLRAREVPEDDTAFLEMPLDKLAQSGIYREVHSKALDERVIFAADNAEVPDDTPLVVYRTNEMRELLGASPEMLRATHEVRKVFDGEIVADEDETRIPSSELLDKSRGACAACGQSRWWTKTCGQRVCAVCHPGPKRND